MTCGETSNIRSVVRVGKGWLWRAMAIFEGHSWWSYHAMFRVFQPSFLGMPYGSRELEVAARENGKMAYRSQYLPSPAAISHSLGSRACWG